MPSFSLLPRTTTQTSSKNLTNGSSNDIPQNLQDSFNFKGKELLIPGKIPHKFWRVKKICPASLCITFDTRLPRKPRLNTYTHIWLNWGKKWNCIISPEISKQLSFTVRVLQQQSPAYRNRCWCCEVCRYCTPRRSDRTAPTDGKDRLYYEQIQTF